MYVCVCVFVYVFVCVCVCVCVCACVYVCLYVTSQDNVIVATYKTQHGLFTLRNMTKFEKFRN